MNLIRNNTFNNDIIFVDGHPRSGKTIISKILECYDGVEISKDEDPIVITQYLYRLGKLDKNTAITMLRIWTDRYLYNQMVGRNINMNVSDVTSLFKNPFPQKYLKRMATVPVNDDIVDEIKRNGIAYQNMTQNAIMEAELYFEAFKHRLKIIYIIRNDDDLIDAIMERHLGERLGTDPTDIGLTIDYNGTPIPHYAINWPEEYMEMTPRERVTRWVHEETDRVMSSYDNLDDETKKKIIFINFDDLVSNPLSQCERIKRFIGREYDKNSLNMILARERCPR